MKMAEQMATEMTLKVIRFFVYNTDEEVETPEPENSLEAAIKLRDELQALYKHETWSIAADIVA